MVRVFGTSEFARGSWTTLPSPIASPVSRLSFFESSWPSPPSPETKTALNIQSPSVCAVHHIITTPAETHTANMPPRDGPPQQTSTADDRLSKQTPSLAPDDNPPIPAHNEPQGDDPQGNTSEQGNAADLSHTLGTNAAAPAAFAAFLADIAQQLQTSHDLVCSSLGVLPSCVDHFVHKLNVQPCDRHIFADDHDDRLTYMSAAKGIRWNLSQGHLFPVVEPNGARGCAPINDGERSNGCFTSASARSGPTA